MSMADRWHTKVLERWRRMCRRPAFVKAHIVAFQRRGIEGGRILNGYRVAA